MQVNKEYIGFGGKYYTLWRVGEKIVSDYRGGSKIETYCFYVKNISMDINKVKELYPDMEIDMNLRGHSSIKISERYEPKKVDEFMCGKFRGQKFSIADNDYLEWYYECTCRYEEVDGLEAELRKRGFELNEKYRGAYSPEKVAKYKEELKGIEEIKELIEKEGCIELTIIGNAFESTFNGWCIPTNFEFLFVKCDDVSYQTYAGYEYYLPKFNGKAKRLKNKKVRIYANVEGIEVKDCTDGRWARAAIKSEKIEVL